MSGLMLNFCLVVLAGLALTEAQQGCAPGWFGSNCQYKCRCRDNCDNNGLCFNRGGCQPGWFGPSCQYVNTVNEGTFDLAKDMVAAITDNNDSTCFSNTSIQKITLTWNTSYPFTWLRIHLKNPDPLPSFNLQFREIRDGTPFNCSNFSSYSPESSVLDIHCSLSLTIQQITLTWNEGNALCSLYISGGRNVALRGNTTSVNFFNYANSKSGNAVDGNYELGSCSDINAITTRWNIDFQWPMMINRYTIYGKGCCPKQLQEFNLISYNENGITVFTHTVSNVYLQSVYSLTNITSPVTRVSINGYRYYYSHVAVSLCEVELYGDSVCQSGKFGRECEQTCNCASKNDSCLTSTGGCLSGCAPGYQGEGCSQVCSNGKYGEGCNATCSEFCQDIEGISPCHNVNGTCLQGCKNGYQGLMCSDVCNHGKYGAECNSTCSQFCQEIVGMSSCHHENGTCLHGCKAGYQGSSCSDECEPWKYSKDCNVTCSQFCLVVDGLSKCDKFDGKCLLGCQPGYYGLTCSTKKEVSSKLTTLNLGLILGNAGTGFILLITLAVVTGVICRCHHKLRRAMSEGPTLYNQPDPINGQDEGNLYELPETQDGRLAVSRNTVQRAETPPQKLRDPNEHHNSNENTHSYIVVTDRRKTAPAVQNEKFLHDKSGDTNVYKSMSKEDESIYVNF